MTTKYESVLSEADKVNLIRDHDDITDLVDRTEQATLAKLQPQLDAIGAGGVSGQRVMQTRTPEGYRLVPIDMLKDALTRVEDVLYKAYNNAQQECCGKGYGGECCGNAVIVWSEDDEAIMDKLSPVQKSITEILSAAPTPDIKDPLTTENQELRIVFSGEAPNLTFVDVENEDGFSVNAGQWHKRFDGYTELRIKAAKE